MDRSAIEYLNYLENSDPFFYKNFKDFIVYASSLNKNLQDNEYKQLKDSKDSEFKIYDSYKIRDKESRNEIIEVLMHYEKENPSKWCRTKESMRLEWYIHNILHDLNSHTYKSTILL